MRKKNLKIVFMGTPDFAAESLKALVENNYQVVGVITSPDRLDYKCLIRYKTVLSITIAFKLITRF